MKYGQKGFSGVEVLLVLALVSLVTFTGWYFWQANDSDGDKAPEVVVPKQSYEQPHEQQSTENNTPRQNKEIEIQAAQDKDPSKCDQIKGESYNFGPVDEQVPITEAEAKKQCRENIENGVVPVLYGG